MASDGLICFRIPAELRAQVEAFLGASGMTLSDWYRTLTIAALTGQPAFGIEEGYHQARALAIELARMAITMAGAQLPASYEEALARLGQEYVPPQR